MDDVVYCDDPACPSCGHRHSDAFELRDKGQMDCDACGGTFYYERIESVSYKTRPIPHSSGSGDGR